MYQQYIYNKNQCIFSDPDVEYPWALHDKATELLLEGQDRNIVVLNLLLLFPKEADD